MENKIFYTAEEILRKQSISDYKDEERLFYFDQAIRAMNQYAAQFIEPKECHQCNGTGDVYFSPIHPVKCENCKGTGKIIYLPIKTNTNT